MHHRFFLGPAPTFYLPLRGQGFLATAERLLENELHWATFECVAGR